MDKMLIATLFTAGLATAIPGAVAQTAPAQTQAPQYRQGEQDRHARRSHQLPSERMEARLARLQEALKITEAQKGLWENFTAVVRKHAREADQRFQARRTQMAERSQRQQLSAIERLERRQQRMATRAQRLDELLAAGKPLYAALSPEQKQVADGLLQQRRGGHQRHRGMRPSA
jgi:phosphoketolase